MDNVWDDPNARHNRQQIGRPTWLRVGLLLALGMACGVWACDPCDDEHHRHDDDWEEECEPDEEEGGDTYNYYYGDDACERPPSRSSEGECGLRDTLISRSWADDYEAATLSFEWATVREDGCVKNDWDVLFDKSDSEDLFIVNTVADDASSIIDLGPGEVQDLPRELEREEYARGSYGKFDFIGVKAGHLYLVHTRDSNTRQFVLFRVVEHELHRSVTLEWQHIPGESRPVV
ncbi:MAG: hypothetical protein AAFS10_15870, partial [Myxococcota bacterium]